MFYLSENILKIFKMTLTFVRFMPWPWLFQIYAMTLRLSAMVEEKMKEIINGWNSAVKHKNSSPRQTTSNFTANAHRYGVFSAVLLLQGPVYNEICFVDSKIYIFVHCIMGFEGKLIYMHSTIHIKSGPNVEFLKILMFQLYMITEQSRKKIFSVSLRICLHSLHFFIFLNQASP